MNQSLTPISNSSTNTIICNKEEMARIRRRNQSRKTRPRPKSMRVHCFVSICLHCFSAIHTFLSPLSLLLSLPFPTPFPFAAASDIIESDQSWKDWNYYQLLGILPEDYYYPHNKSTGKKNAYSNSKAESSREWHLKSRRERIKERNAIHAKDIKKSYRKQAQAWHPDKIASRKRQQTNSTNANTNANANGIDYSNISVEECNARFAKIAEAYEVLNDENKRRDYDMFLLDTEDQMDEEKRRQRQQQRHHHEARRSSDSGHRASSSSSSWSSSSAASSTSNDFYQKTNDFFSQFFTDGDPMTTFEEFFFGGSKNDPSGSGSSTGNNGKNFMNDLFDSFYGGSTAPQEGNGDSAGRGEQRNAYPQHNRQPDRTSEKTQVRYDPRLGREVMSVYLREEFDEPRKRQIYYRVIAQEFIQDVDFYGRPIGYAPITEPTIVEEGHLPLKDERRRTSGREERKQNQRQHRRRKPLKLTSHRLEKHEYITPESLHLHSANGEYYAGLTPDCELVIMHDEGPFEEDTLFWTSNTYVPAHHRSGCALAMYGARIAIIIGDVENPNTFLWSSPPPPPIVPSVFEGEESIDFYLSLDSDGSLVLYRSRIQEDGEMNDECVFATGNGGCNSAGRRFIVISNKIKRSVEKVVSHLDEKVGDIIDSLNQDRDDGVPFVDILKSRVDNITVEGKSRIEHITFKVKRYYAVFRPKLVLLIHTIRQYFHKVSSQVDDKVSGIMDSLYESGEDDSIDLFDTVLCIIGKGFQNIMNKIR